MFVSPNSLIIGTIITPSTGNAPSSTTINPQQELQNRKIIRITAFSSLDIAIDPMNPTPGTVLTPALFAQTFLTLYVSPVTNNTFFGGKQEAGDFYSKIPLSLLRSTQNNDTNLTPLVANAFTPFLIRPTEIAWTKCKFELPASPAMSEPMSAVIQVDYLDEGDDGEWWMQSMGFMAANKSK